MLGTPRIHAWYSPAAVRTACLELDVRPRDIDNVPTAPLLNRHAAVRVDDGEVIEQDVRHSGVCVRAELDRVRARPHCGVPDRKALDDKRQR